MPMTKKDRKLYEKEVARIRKEKNFPEDVPIVLLDVDAESTSWIEDSGLGGEEAKVGRAKARAKENREEGGE